MANKISPISLIFAMQLAAFSLYADEDQCEATMAKEWSYLYQNDSFFIRQKIISSILKSEGIERVIEIGGFCTPICKYYDVKYTNIDPYLKSLDKRCTRGELIKKSFEDVDVQQLDVNEPFAFVFLGIWLGNLKTDLNENLFLKQILSKAKLVFIESVKNEPGNTQVYLLKNLIERAGYVQQFAGLFWVDKENSPENFVHARQFFYYKKE